ncbi:Sulfur carrier protein adenylyltransferase ThiF [hydrothermal vent metagenome]|uniref:Sulfur carrier protein adenylyltransferase ThiF n=1 Tax=hydrothermal vent metagenome TaxID=652676 RepID=A0A1W1C270_9ZZZZ
MNDEQLERYSKQIMLPQVDIKGQEKLLNSTVLIVGLGGLGSPTALYLASAGVGKLILADFDTVDLSNLQRQIIHSQNDIGDLKVNSALKKIKNINNDIKIETLVDINEKTLQQAINMSDIVLDGTDNFKSRFMINKYCFFAKTPLVSASVIRFEGQLSVYKPWLKDQPCYQCLYSPNESEDKNCVTNGIIAPMAGVLGSFQALEAIKVLLDLEHLLGKLLLIDGLQTNFRIVNVKKDSNCNICNK